MSSTTPEADLAMLLRRAGFDLTPAQIAEYAEPYACIQEMAVRIRSSRSYMAEPAHAFGFPIEAPTSENKA